MVFQLTGDAFEQHYRERWMDHNAGGPVDFQALTATNASQALVVPDGARSAVLQADGATVRFTFGNEPPTATNGFQALAGEKIELTGNDTLRAFRFIREGGADVPLMVQFFA